MRAGEVRRRVVIEERMCRPSVRARVARRGRQVGRRPWLRLGPGARVCLDLVPGQRSSERLLWPSCGGPRCFRGRFLTQPRRRAALMRTRWHWLCVSNSRLPRGGGGAQCSTRACAKRVGRRPVRSSPQQGYGRLPGSRGETPLPTWMERGAAKEGLGGLTPAAYAEQLRAKTTTARATAGL